MSQLPRPPNPGGGGKYVPFEDPVATIAGPSSSSSGGAGTNGIALTEGLTQAPIQTPIQAPIQAPIETPSQALIQTPTQAAAMLPTAIVPTGSTLLSPSGPPPGVYLRLSSPLQAAFQAAPTPRSFLDLIAQTDTLAMANLRNSPQNRAQNQTENVRPVSAVNAVDSSNGHVTTATTTNHVNHSAGTASAPPLPRLTDEEMASVPSSQPAHPLSNGYASDLSSQLDGVSLGASANTTYDEDSGLGEFPSNKSNDQDRESPNGHALMYESDKDTHHQGPDDLSTWDSMFDRPMRTINEPVAGASSSRDHQLADSSCATNAYAASIRNSHVFQTVRPAVPSVSISRSFEPNLPFASRSFESYLPSIIQAFGSNLPPVIGPLRPNLPSITQSSAPVLPPATELPRLSSATNEPSAIISGCLPPLAGPHARGGGLSVIPSSSRSVQYPRPASFAPRSASLAPSARTSQLSGPSFFAGNDLSIGAAELSFPYHGPDSAAFQAPTATPFVPGSRGFRSAAQYYQGNFSNEHNHYGGRFGYGEEYFGFPGLGPRQQVFSHPGAHRQYHEHHVQYTGFARSPASLVGRSEEQVPLDFIRSQYRPVNQHGPVTQYEPTTQYGPTAQYGPATQYGPTTQYGAVTQYGPTTQYGAVTQYGPATQYGAVTQYGPATQYRPPTQYGPAIQHGPANQHRENIRYREPSRNRQVFQQPPYRLPYTPAPPPPGHLLPDEPTASESVHSDDTEIVDPYGARDKEAAADAINRLTSEDEEVDLTLERLHSRRRRLENTAQALRLQQEEDRLSRLLDQKEAKKVRRQ